MKKTALLLSCVLLFSGCATAVKYKVNKKLYHKEEANEVSGIVDIFQDLRTDDEHNGTFSTTKKYLYTKDKNFKKDIALQVSNILAVHLKKTKVLSNAETRDIDDDVLNNEEELVGLIEEGFDIIVFGDLHSFYGYQSGATSAAVASLFGVTGVLTEALINRKVVGGRTVLGDLKIIDLHARKVLWSGDIDHDFEHKETFYNGPPAYAIMSLREANNKFVQKIDEVLNTEVMGKE